MNDPEVPVAASTAPRRDHPCRTVPARRSRARPAARAVPGPGRAAHRAGLRPRVDPADLAGNGGWRDCRRPAELIVSELATNALLASGAMARLSSAWSSPSKWPGASWPTRPRLLSRRSAGPARRRGRRERPRAAAGPVHERPVRLVPVRRRVPGKVVWAVREATPVASGDLAARFMPLAPAWPERARHLASGHAGPRTPYAHARQ